MIYILKKLLRLASLLVAVTILSFILVSYSPIDPVQTYIGAEANVSLEQRENIAAYWGLNEPRPIQFGKWVGHLFHGDFGQSLIYRTPVTEVIGERFLASLILMLTAWILSGILGFLLGIIAGMVKGTWLDQMIKGFCFLLASTPAFWLGIVLLMIFSVSLGWFPVGLSAPAGMLSGDVSFLAKIHHLVLPTLTLSIVGVANVALHTRQKLIDIWQTEFILYAKAKGEQPLQILINHGIRNISLPAITLHFASFGELFGGAILTEQVFSYPGLGQAIIKAGLGGDVPLLLGIVIFSTIFVFAGNFMADLLYKIIDPRMRRGVTE